MADSPSFTVNLREIPAKFGFSPTFFGLQISKKENNSATTGTNSSTFREITISIQISDTFNFSKTRKFSITFNNISAKNQFDNF